MTNEIRISEKVNSSGWCHQAIINHELKIVVNESFIFKMGDVTKLSNTQFKNFINHYLSVGYKEISFEEYEKVTK